MGGLPQAQECPGDGQHSLHPGRPCLDGRGLVDGPKGEFATSGLYAWTRHPQYAGFILIIIAFVVRWPTIITLIMFPVLVATYWRLAKGEEAELEARFCSRYVAYTRHVPIFVPGLHRQAAKDAPV